MHTVQRPRSRAPLEALHVLTATKTSCNVMRAHTPDQRAARCCCCWRPLTAARWPPAVVGGIGATIEHLCARGRTLRGISEARGVAWQRLGQATRNARRSPVRARAAANAREPHTGVYVSRRASSPSRQDDCVAPKTTRIGACGVLKKHRHSGQRRMARRRAAERAPRVTRWRTGVARARPYLWASL